MCPTSALVGSSIARNPWGVVVRRTMHRHGSHQIDDPSNPGQQICQDSKGGTSQFCCANDSTQPCFPDVITRNGLAAIPIDDGTGASSATEVFAGTFCIPPTGTCTVDSLTGLPGLGAVLPVHTTWSSDRSRRSDLSAGAGYRRRRPLRYGNVRSNSRTCWNVGRLVEGNRFGRTPGTNPVVDASSFQRAGST